MDEESARILKTLAKPHNGNKGLAVREAIKLHGALESMLDEFERSNGVELRRQKLRSERSFRNGTFVAWEEVKRRARL